MTQLAEFPALAGIEDQLDAMGQKYRVQRIVRGGILWVATAVIATWMAALAAHWVGGSRWTWIIDGVWLLMLLCGAVVWVVLPLLIRPKAAAVARLLEARVPGLHNGPSNSLLLAKAEDLRDSPWLEQIFQEIHTTMIDRPLGEAVKLSDLSTIAFRAAGVCALLVIVWFCFPMTFAHGWEQMIHPVAFVPQMGAMRILEIAPGDVTLVAGEPLEIVAKVTGPENSTAMLYFDEADPLLMKRSDVTDSHQRYSYRVEHVDKTMRYRLEIGGTQSRWFTATVVRQIRLKQMSVKIQPPGYTHRPVSVMVLTPEQIEGTAVTVPQGSLVSIEASVDVPANGAMLQSGDGQPVAMSGNIEKTTFSGSMTIEADTATAILLTDGAGQIVATLPGEQWVIHCAKDVAPAVQMKWPTHDVVIAPAEPVKVSATLSDDYGLVSSRVLMGIGMDGPMAAVGESQVYGDGTLSAEVAKVLDLPADVRRAGNSIRVQVEATDNRDLPEGLGAQTTSSPVFQIRFEDPEAALAEQMDQDNKLAAILTGMLKTQKNLAVQTSGYKAGNSALMERVNVGQSKLRDLMQSTAETFAFGASEKIVQKTLLVLALNPAKEAVDLSAASAPIVEQLQSRQRQVIDTLESLLAMLNAQPQPATQPVGKRGDQLLTKADEFKKLDEALKQFMKEQQRILDQTAGLAKKPVDNFDDKDKKLLDELTQQQDKMDAFMKAKISDFSKLGEQDMSNGSLLKDLMSVSTEVTMAKDALNQKSTEIAVPAEENGIEGAKEISTNIEKWLADSPDRTKWTQEELPDKSDTPMAELPKELEDMVGQLMEQEEDLLDEAEDMNANITDSIDKGVGWDAMDGPIADMSAKGVTGNVLPNNNEMGGRSGEGRSGQSQGEFVGDSAVGKGGRNTPTRLDPTAFQQGQINDTSKDPVGGATGGGKMSGQGAAGLEGPVPPALQQGLKRLATKQAEIRNAAERLNLQYLLGRYDNFKLADSIALMRLTESDLNANRYQSALRQRDVLLDDMNTSHLLLSGQIHVQQDTTPTVSMKSQQDLNDAMKGELPSAWSDALKEYYKKLSAE
jgi:hypothetical protein